MNKKQQKSKRYLENEKPKRNKIINWTINLKWDNGTYENISCMNNETAQMVDDFLSELEDERAKQNGAE